MKRYGSVIGVRQEKLAEYKQLHAAVWPDVLKMIKACNIRNYSIYLRKLPDGQHYLFSYFEYTGSDFGADMAKMAAQVPALFEALSGMNVAELFGKVPQIRDKSPKPDVLPPSDGDDNKAKGAGAGK